MSAKLFDIFVSYILLYYTSSLLFLVLQYINANESVYVNLM